MRETHLIDSWCVYTSVNVIHPALNYSFQALRYAHVKKQESSEEEDLSQTTM